MKSSQPTVKELKKRKEAMVALKARVQSSIASSNSRNKRKPPSLQPIYDDVFARGSQQIEALAGTSPDGLDGDAHLSDDIWTSEVRTRGRLP